MSIRVFVVLFISDTYYSTSIMKITSNTSEHETILSKVLSALLVVLPFSPFLVAFTGSMIGQNRFFSAWKELILYLLLGVMFYIHSKTVVKLLKTNTSIRAVALYLAFLSANLLTKGVTISSLAGFVYNTRFLVVFLIAIFIMNTDKMKRRFFAVSALVLACAYLIFVLPNSLLGNIGYDTGTVDTINSPQAIYYVSDDLQIERLMGPTKGPNSLGLYLLIPFALLLFSPRHLKKYWWFALLLFVSVCVTFSRTAFLVMLFILVAYCWPKRKSLVTYIHGVSKVYLVLIATCVVGLILISAPFTRQLIFHQSVGDSNGSTSARVEDVEQSLREVAKNPWGSGQGSASLAGRVDNTSIDISENYYLQVAREVGIVGLALFLTMYYLVYRSIKQSKSKYSFVLNILMIAFAIGNIFLPIWSEELVSITFWALIGSVFATTLTTHKDVRNDYST